MPTQLETDQAIQIFRARVVSRPGFPDFDTEWWRFYEAWTRFYRGQDAPHAPTPAAYVQGLARFQSRFLELVTGVPTWMPFAVIGGGALALYLVTRLLK